MTAHQTQESQLRQRNIDATHRCPRDRTALLVVDMQRGFLDPGASLEVPQGRAIIPAVRRLIQCCRTVGVPVLFTQFVYTTAVPCLRGNPFGVEHLPAHDGQLRGFGRPSSNCLVGPKAGRDAESAEIVPDLSPLPKELVVASHVYDKFLDTPLDLALRARQVTHLMVTGVVTDICVNCTVLSAANRNYHVTVVTDGVATLSDEIQAACFDIWRRKFARLRTTRQLVRELNRAQ
ncbi:MAG: cysteine hydrolase [Pirellulaceae bacterium]|jgi:ureidoacrylate peracid hydrolase|nr:cysteine hydrolase [Pirellulaceae bacterium]